MSRLGDLLLLERSRQKLTRKQVARMCGISEGYLKDVEEGRRIIQELEGDEGQQHVEEYSDVHTERGQCLLKRICEKFGFNSLEYQTLEGLIKSIGLPKEKICTYCWTGEE